jgi:hypothetical protein
MKRVYRVAYYISVILSVSLASVAVLFAALGDSIYQYIDAQTTIENLATIFNGIKAVSVLLAALFFWLSYRLEKAARYQNPYYLDYLERLRSEEEQKREAERKIAPESHKSWWKKLRGK